jgi:transposase InsO family protein
MIASKAIRGVPSLHFLAKTCSGCQLGKHAKTKLPKEATYHASKILQLVHSDVCGPFKINSTRGAKYFVTFVDDYSQKIRIYFISQKSQVLEKFRHFMQLMTNSIGQTVRTLRMDNGGEYTSKAFQDFCSSRGIARELTPPHTQQRNGIAKWRNRYLLDITQCLLLDKGLPGHLWGEAVKAVGDILNLRSTKRHPDKTPNELFSGTKPSIAHLRIFGSPVFVHIPKPSRTKLDPRSEKCILLSFDEIAKAYRCYRLSTIKFFVSRDIVIDENCLFTPAQTPEPQSSLLVDNTPAPTRREESQILLDLQPPSPASNLQVSPPRPQAFDSLPELPQSSPPTLSNVDSPSSIPVEINSPTPSPENILPRRSDRIKRFPRHLHDFAAHVELNNPITVPELQLEELTFQQVHTEPYWKATMQEEIDSIHANHTWTLVELPPNKKTIYSRWVYKVKPSTLPRYKARLIARGFEQKDGIDFLNTFAPVVRWETIRILIAIATHLNWPICQLDVLTAFLNGIMEEDVYMHQPLGFILRGAEHLVCKLHKSLYGLRQSPRAWYARLHATFLAWNLTQSHFDPNLYFAHIGNDTIALQVYVDDIIVTGSNLSLITQLKNHLHCTFKTNDLGPIQRYLGVQFDRDSTGLHMHQTEYALSILHLFNMEHCTPSHTPLL